MYVNYLILEGGERPEVISIAIREPNPTAI